MAAPPSPPRLVQVCDLGRPPIEDALALLEAARGGSVAADFPEARARIVARGLEGLLAVGRARVGALRADSRITIGVESGGNGSARVTIDTGGG